MHTIIMKFGGASLSTAEGISQTCHIVKKYHRYNKIVLVVSAMKGITDMLYQIVDLLKQNKTKQVLVLIDTIRKNHFNTLVQIDSTSSAIKKIEADLNNLFFHLEHFIANVIHKKKKITLARIDYIVSFGERFSCPIVAYALEVNGMIAYPIDASSVIATDGKFGDATPLYTIDQHHINGIISPLIKENIIPVVTGFIGFAHDGCTVTLGRGGSDLTAAYLAYLLDAKGIYLWKDVEGFYTADPHKNVNARLLRKLSYSQAFTLAQKGAKIIYHKAIAPVRKKHIPIYVKSFLNPIARGSVIS